MLLRLKVVGVLGGELKMIAAVVWRLAEELSSAVVGLGPRWKMIVVVHSRIRR